MFWVLLVSCSASLFCGIVLWYFVDVISVKAFGAAEVECAVSFPYDNGKYLIRINQIKRIFPFIINSIPFVLIYHL